MGGTEMARERARGTRKAWTAASAARFAREARAQTVMHLARAQAPVKYEADALTVGFKMWRDMYGTAQNAAEMLLAPMGYPPPYDGTFLEYAERIVRDTSTELAMASMFVISPTMHDVVVAAAETLTLEDLNRVDEADPPALAGLVVFPSPLIRVDAAGDLVDNRAISWAPATFRLSHQAARPGVVVTSFVDTFGPVRVAAFDQFAEQARMHGEPLPPLTLDARQALPFHHDILATPEEMNVRAGIIRDVSESGRAKAEELGMDATTSVGEYESGAQVSDPDDTLTRRYLIAFWRLCEQHIADVEQADVPHSAIATATRARTSPDASVVTLRQRRRVNDDPATASPVNWTSRWIVRMHKVEQWYPSLQTHRVLWRGPYVKGPEGLPVKQPAVSALIR